ncbi:MAG: gamma-glutamylcyclotransferase [Chloroflexi bacterium]|nr:gamma-glutamylcyclotransferase [Chloroflexota bacterium]
MLRGSPNTRLAAYGTLRPGESNHAVIGRVPGAWIEGTVRGVRFEANGYPAFQRRRRGAQVPVSVLTSAALPEHWARLDAFEGDDYRRILVTVSLPTGATLRANLYEYIGPAAGSTAPTQQSQPRGGVPSPGYGTSRRRR